MKKLFTIIAILFSFAATAQKSLTKTIELKGDTLFVTPGSCKIIKIGDKVYKLTTTIDEVPEKLTFGPGIFYGGSMTPNYNITPAVKIMNLGLDTNK